MSVGGASYTDPAAIPVNAPSLSDLSTQTARASRKVARARAALNTAQVALTNHPVGDVAKAEALHDALQQAEDAYADAVAARDAAELADLVADR